MLLRIIIPAIFVLCLQASLKAQYTSQTEINSVVTDFINKEKALASTDTLCVYEHYCVGCMVFTDEILTQTASGEKKIIIDDENYCKSATAYILYKQDGTTYITKFDRCYNYQIMRLDNNSIWDSFFVYKHIIKKEVPKMFQYKTADGQVITTTIDHSFFQDFKLFNQDSITSFSFDAFDFGKTNELGGSDRININYTHNKNLKARAFANRIQKLVDNLEQEHAFSGKRR